jgi:hypothetical protein
MIIIYSADIYKGGNSGGGLASRWTGNGRKFGV